MPVMKVPSWEVACRLLQEGSERNPGPWVEHSKHAAIAARLIAERLPDADAEIAATVVLLHDIGRRDGIHGMRHVMDGYRYLMGLGYNDAARVCLTHSFPFQDPQAFYGEWDGTPEDFEFLRQYLAQSEYSVYDQLGQLCDSLAIACGFVTVEKRAVGVIMRYGCSTFAPQKMKAIYDIMANFEAAMGCSIYPLLPGLVENTLDSRPAV